MVKIKFLFKIFPLIVGILFSNLACGDDTNRKNSSPFMKALTEQETAITKMIDQWLKSVVNIVDTSLDQNSSLGTGFIVSSDGYIVTNNHVICDAEIDKIKILLHDGTELAPKLVGQDPRSDVALLKVCHYEKLKYLELGNSDEAEVGMRVFAIGNPFGFGHTVTSGIISYKSRNLEDSLSKINGVGLVNYLQTDAAINIGNSGGPLISLTKGAVIGMNASMFSNSDSNVGINFAIPSNTIKTIIEQLKKFGKIRRPWFGIAFEDIPSDVLKTLKICGYDNAVSITKIEDDSPAKSGNLQIGDIILEFNGKKLNGDTKLVQVVNCINDEEKVYLKIKRNKMDGKNKDSKNGIMSVTLNVMYKDSEEHTKYDTVTAIGLKTGQYLEDLGITVCDMTPDLVKLLDVQNSDGIIITNISNAGLADKMDIQIGDVILGVIRENVKTGNISSVNDFKNCLADIKKGIQKNEILKLVVFIERNKTTYYKLLKFPLVATKNR